MREWRARHKGYCNEYSKEYRQKNKAKVKAAQCQCYLSKRSEYKERSKTWTANNRERARHTSQAAYYNNPERNKAHGVVNSAIRKGKLKRGKCHCGKVAEAHHEDYSKPLEIEWLCTEHHNEMHRERRIKWAE